MSNRREILKKIGLTGAWTTPIVTSIILPAHAETSSTLIYSERSISVVVSQNQAKIRFRKFFDGGCPICGSEVEYQAITDLVGSSSNLVATDFGCGTIAPSILGTASVQNYSIGNSTITVSIESTEITSSTIIVSIGGEADLGPFLCS